MYYDYSGISHDQNALLLEVYRLNAILASVHLLYAKDEGAAYSHKKAMDYWMRQRLELQDIITDEEDGNVTIKMTVPLEEIEKE